MKTEYVLVRVPDASGAAHDLFIGKPVGMDNDEAIDFVDKAVDYVKATYEENQMYIALVVELKKEGFWFPEMIYSTEVW